MNQLLITGASGNIGRELTQALRAKGLAFDTLRSKPSAEAGTRVASYDDPASLTRAFEGVQTLFVLLPLTPQKLQHARHVAQAAKAAGVAHIVRSSGAGADVNAPFALPKLQGEVDKVFEDTGLATTFLRPAGFMQNYSTFMAGMVKSGSLYGANANAPQSMVDVRDIAAVAATVLADPAAHAGRAYTLTGGEALTDSERAALLGQATGRTVSYIDVGPQAANDSMVQMGMPAQIVEWLSSLNALVAAGYAAAISPDVERLLQRPPIRFSQFVADHRAAWL